jgi:hypothetical protein
VASLSSAAGVVLDRLRAGSPSLGTTRLLCVDGPAGSGKTTLAAALERRVRDQGAEVATVHMDDLYEGWSGLNASLESRVRTQILAPLAAGTPARWQRYDWYAGRLADWVDLPPPEVLVLEGCGSGAVGYARFIGVLVFLEAPRALRIVRGEQRDGVQVRDHWRAWMELEEAHFAANHTRERADVVLGSDDS